MENSTLLDLRPTILSFRRAIGALVHKGVYKQHPDGRPSDCFAYILKGSATYDFGSYAFNVKAGDILFLSKGSVYTMTVHEEYGFLHANFLLNTSENTSVRCEAFTAPSGKATEDLFHKMLSIWYLARQTAKEDCLALLYMIYSDFLKSANANYLHSGKKNLMEQAINFINENLGDENLTVAKIAASVRMGERHFRRSFKEAHGISPLRYINMKRITRAKELLRFSDMPLGEIATVTGYSSIYYFSNAFKKEVACAPSEYRKSQKKHSLL